MRTRNNRDNTPQQSSSTAIATYGEWTPEQMEEEAREMSSGGAFWKVPVGRSLVRLLPPKIGWKSPFVIQHQHFIRMPGSQLISFCCPKSHESKLCLVCQQVEKLESSGHGRDARAAAGLKSQRRMITNLITEPSRAEAPVRIWSFGAGVYQQLKTIREDPESGGNFLDPVNGMNLSIVRVGTGKNDTQYTISAARSSTPLMNMEWIELQTDLRKMIRLPTPEQQQRLLDGDDPRDVWGEDFDDDRPREDRRARRADSRDVIDADAREVRTAEDDLFDDEADLD